MSAPVYRFLPWARRGLAQGVLDDETIAVDGDHPLPARSTLPVSMDVNGVPADTTVQLYGPGDVTGIDRRVVLRSDPAPGATDFEPNYLVTVDFDPPDLPWMFTPARAVGDQLRPWCVLIVVERTAGVAISIRPGAVLPVLSITEPANAQRELPNLADSWAWAHAQVLEEAGSNPGNDLHVDLDVDPDRNLSRLVCPRILQPNTPYLAAVVPAFDHGVQRGLGDEPSGGTARPAWDPTVTSIELPMYHSFEFATAVPDDIESMAERLHGPEHAPPALGRRRVLRRRCRPGDRGVAAPARRRGNGHDVRRPASRVDGCQHADAGAGPGADAAPHRRRGGTGHAAAAAAAVRRVGGGDPRAAGAAAARLVRRAEQHRRPPHRSRARRGRRAPPPGGVRAVGVAAGRPGP